MKSSSTSNGNVLMNRMPHRRNTSTGTSSDEKPKPLDASPHMTRRRMLGGSSNYSSNGSFHASLPMGGDNTNTPQAFIDDENPAYYSNRRKTYQSRSGGGSWATMFLLFVTLAAAGGYFFVSYHERNLMKAELKEQEEAIREVEVDLSMKFDSKIKALTKEKELLEKKILHNKDMKIQNQQLKDENRRLETRIEESLETNKNSQAVDGLETQVVGLKEANTQLRENKRNMQKAIQQMSKKALLEKFGPGPHFVEMFIRFDSGEGRADGGYITLELAPVDEMPHAVYWFLEQVERKLYDGCSFHRNAVHVIQAGPVPNFLTPANTPSLAQRFKDAGFHSVLFQEYSPNFQHKKYTVGYAGRPGGPDFYISTKDNSKIHGPGGQSNYEDAGEADPCFAKVTYGQDIVERMRQSPVNEGDYRAMQKSVAIVFMKRIQINQQ